MLSAERVIIHFALVLSVPHKTLFVWSSIAVQLGMGVQRGSWKCLGDLIPRAGSVHCAPLLDCVQYGFLWESMDSEGMAPSLESKDSSLGEAYQLHWDLPTTDMDAWAKVMAPDSWIYFPLISKQGEFLTFSQSKKKINTDLEVLDWLPILFTRKLAEVRSFVFCSTHCLMCRVCLGFFRRHACLLKASSLEFLWS